MKARHSVYSPFPAATYKIDALDKCEVTWIMSLDIAHAAWNLFYLSVPGVDALPGSGRNWWRDYRVTPGAAGAVAYDINDNEVLYRKLLMAPERFLDWFERADHQSFRCFETLGGFDWVDDVISRARLIPPIIVETGNVVRADFRRLIA